MSWKQALFYAKAADKRFPISPAATNACKAQNIPEGWLQPSFLYEHSLTPEVRTAKADEINQVRDFLHKTWKVKSSSNFCGKVVLFQGGLMCSVLTYQPIRSCSKKFNICRTWDSKEVEAKNPFGRHKSFWQCRGRGMEPDFSWFDHVPNEMSPKGPLLLPPRLNARILNSRLVLDCMAERQSF